MGGKGLSKSEMENNVDQYGEGSGLELVHVSNVLDYLGKHCQDKLQRCSSNCIFLMYFP